MARVRSLRIIRLQWLQKTGFPLFRRRISQKLKRIAELKSLWKQPGAGRAYFWVMLNRKRLKSTSKRSQQPSLLIFWRSSTSRWGDRMALFTRGRPFAEWGRRFIDSSGSPRTHGWTSLFSETTQLSMKPLISSTPNSEFWRREESWRQHAIPPNMFVWPGENRAFIRTTLDEPIDATNLTLAGWFILTFHPGLRGREMQLVLRKQDLLFSKTRTAKRSSSWARPSPRKTMPVVFLRWATTFLLGRCRIQCRLQSFESLWPWATRRSTVSFSAPVPENVRKIHTSSLHL